jgi:ABC-type phosphate/phosphonate transport system substrate-binding protein
MRDPQLANSIGKDDVLLLGAVAYDAKVVGIWEGFRRVFEARGLPFDFVLFSNYERQVEALLDGFVHLAWNSPLAWIEAVWLARARGRTASAIAMRDSDCDLTSVILVRAREDRINGLADLRGRTVAVGAADSPQATLIPLLQIAEVGLIPGSDFDVLRHDLLLGKHGDHIGGERQAVGALLAGRADAACVLDASSRSARKARCPPDPPGCCTRPRPMTTATSPRLTGRRRRWSSVSARCCCPCPTTIPKCGSSWTRRGSRPGGPVACRATRSSTER